MAEGRRWSVEELETAIHELRSASPEEAVVALTGLANRAIIDLHNVARGEAGKRRGEPDWGQWARLANAARSAVLQIAAVRDTLKAMRAAAPRGSDPPDGQ